MDIELILLKAQCDAFRTYFISLLKHLMDNDPHKTWLAKYLLWNFERGNLSALDCTLHPSSPDSDRISHRRFQLQVLMDVAYIQGHLEAFDIPRKISQDAADFAGIVYTRSDGSEELMCQIIDELNKP